MQAPPPRARSQLRRPAPRAAMHQHLGQIRAMRLIFRQVEDQLHRADDAAASSATRSARSPRAVAAATRRQKAEALSRLKGLMKLTDAPPSTQSIKRSASSTDLLVRDAGELPDYEAPLATVDVCTVRRCRSSVRSSSCRRNSKFNASRGLKASGSTECKRSGAPRGPRGRCATRAAMRAGATLGAEAVNSGSCDCGGDGISQRVALALELRQIPARLGPSRTSECRRARRPAIRSSGSRGPPSRCAENTERVAVLDRFDVHVRHPRASRRRGR